MESKFYIKEKDQESGPYTLAELKALKIRKHTLVRPETETAWKKAGLYEELYAATNRTLGAGFTFILVLLFIFAGYYLYREKNFPSTPDEGNTENSGQVSGEETENEFEVEEEITAPEIEYKVTKHQKKLFKEMFKDCNKTKKVLVKACNYSQEEVRNFAVKVAGSHPGQFNIAQVCDLFDHCYKNWKYVEDPRTKEYVSKASETIKNELNGDCDDFAVLMCSLILSVGGEARINYAWGHNGGHAFTEVNLGKTPEDELIKYISNRYYMLKIFGGNLNGKKDNNGNLWLNLDWFAENPGGEYFEYNIGYSFYILQKYCENIDASNEQEIEQK